MNPALATRRGLEHALSARFGGCVAAVDRRPSAYQSSFLLDDVDVRLCDGTTVALVAKAASDRGMSTAAQRAKPAFVANAQRERACYESLLPPLGVDVPGYHGTFHDAAGVPYILLDRLDGRPLWQFGEVEAWHAAARWLADLHERASRRPALDPGAGRHLLRYDVSFYHAWLLRARAFSGTALPEPLESAYPRAVERLLREAPVFIHGEFYPSNVIVMQAGEGFAAQAIDWEMAALGPAAMDLACLLAGGWTDDAREGIARAYYEARGAGIGPQDWRQFLMTVDCCLVHLSVRNLGWSRHWSPPPDRDHDWLGDALRLCSKWNF